MLKTTREMAGEIQGWLAAKQSALRSIHLAMTLPLSAPEDPPRSVKKMTESFKKITNNTNKQMKQNHQPIQSDNPDAAELRNRENKHKFRVN